MDYKYSDGTIVPPEDIQRMRWYQGIASDEPQHGSVRTYLAINVAEYEARANAAADVKDWELMERLGARAAAYRDALRVLDDAICQIETPRTYKVLVEADVEAWTEAQAMHEAARCMVQGNWAAAKVQEVR